MCLIVSGITWHRGLGEVSLGLYVSSPPRIMQLHVASTSLVIAKQVVVRSTVAPFHSSGV